MPTIEIPTFNWSAFYYPQILEALLQFKRINVPEYTEETPQDPLIQMLRAFALVGHLNNTLLDVVANENTIVTAKLPETIRNMLKLIDYQLSSASPSVVDVLYRLSQTVTSGTALISVGSQVATRSTQDEAEILFETLEALTIQNDSYEVSGVYTYDVGTDTYTNNTVAAKSASGSYFEAWTTAPEAGDIIYIGHTDVMFDEVRILFETQGNGLTGFWEYYDGDWQDDKPVEVVDEVGYLRIYLTAASSPATMNQEGRICRVRLDSSGAYEDCLVTWSAAQDSPGRNYIETTDYLGQSSPSVNEDDYTVGYDWNEIQTVTDDSNGLSGESGNQDPDSVTQIAGPALQVVLTGLLGSTDESGSTIRVRLDSSGAYEDVTSLWGDLGGGNVNYAETATTLGQGGSPSTTVSDYDVSLISDTCDVSFPIPQTITDNWIKTPDTLSIPEGYWVRFRITRVTNPISPEIEQVRIDTGTQYVLAVATQGQSQIDSNLWTSDGTADQFFETTKEGFIDGSATVTVDSVEWTQVENFLGSTATSLHYYIRLGENDRATIYFGDGISGAIPDSGASISASYRYGVDNDGNAGANTVVVDRSGLNYVYEITNPRPATGWQAAESSSESSLELAKVLGPASLRAKTVAISPDDVVYLAKQWVDENTNTRPISRGFAIEGSYGPKTVELVVVVAGGGTPATGLLDSLEEYFNGDPLASPPLEKHIVANQEVVVTNYLQKVIDIEIEVSGSSVSVTALRTHFTQLLQPEALSDDGINYEWNFGGTIYQDRIVHEAHKANAGIDTVTVLTPSADIELNSRELPILGELIITEV